MWKGVLSEPDTGKVWATIKDGTVDDVVYHAAAYLEDFESFKPATSRWRNHVYVYMAYDVDTGAHTLDLVVTLDGTD